MPGLSSKIAKLTMKIASEKNRVTRIPSVKKCAMALKAIGRQQTITGIAQEFNCSRTTVHEQKNRALEAAADAFDEADDKALLTLSVTKPLLHKMVVALF